jgi:hypothetical protein
MFSQYIAYRRLAYQIDVKVQTGNPSHPIHEAKVRSKRGTTGETEPYPLPLTIDIATNLPEERGEINVTRSREIDSPNLTRIANRLPISMTVNEAGKQVQKTVHYDPANYPEPKPPVDTTPPPTPGAK